MKLILGLALFAAGVYLLAGQTEGSAGFWGGFALIAFGLYSVARSRRRKRGRVGTSGARPGRGRREGAGGGDGRSDPEGEGGDGGNGDGGGDGGD